MSKPLQKHFEYDFHSADYHLMMEILTALMTIMEHLIKEFAENKVALETYTALEFMCNLYHISKDTNIGFMLKKIGIQNASSPQQRCLKELPLTATFSGLELFVQWIDKGFYNFKHVPCLFKEHLRKQDVLAIGLLTDWWPMDSTDSEIMKELQQLFEVLEHSEQDILSHANEAFEVCVLVRCFKIQFIFTYRNQLLHI